ncbi:hypothetical protein EU528_12005 [Candidatus Thorarchaeota archaeon]|nr:MAG: hypothetical protein EU528_12005 [Candidatus Thorarchaeota archaeon]
MTSEKSTMDEARKTLYTYWHELDYFSEKDSTYVGQVRQSEVKWFIIKFIRDGIEDEFGKENNLSRRHAFSAKELHEAYNNNSAGKNLSLSNFHFHINDLVEHGLLQEVAKILEGRHYVTYYGRTSIAFLDQNDAPLQSKIGRDFFDPLKRMIQDMNPDLEFEYISQLVDDNLSSMVDFYSRLISWIEVKYSYLYKSKMDLDMLMNIVAHYSFFHKDLTKSSKEIASLIDLRKIMSYERYELSWRN